MPPLSLLLIDAHEALRQGLGPLLERAEDPGCAVVLYAGDPNLLADELSIAGGPHGVAVRGGGPPHRLTAPAPVAGAAPGAVRPARARLSVLTKRELEVLELLSRGLTGEQIADKLVLSGQTVKTHVRNAMFKLEATTRVHAIAIAMRRGYITGPGLPTVAITATLAA